MSEPSDTVPAGAASGEPAAQSPNPAASVVAEAPVAAPAGGGSGDDGAPPPTGAPPGPSDPSDGIDALIFKRDVDEVHLLIDFISGRAEKSLSDLTVPNPAFDPNATLRDPAVSQTLTSTETVKRLTLIRYPPSRIARVKAEDAALLLLARDRLSRLAMPARSVTIAYTELFVGSKVDGPDYRRGLAQDVFPGLAPHVRKFKIVYVWLIALSFVWLLLTAFTYWDVAMGRSILQGIDQVNQEQSTIVKADANAATCASRPTDAACMRMNMLNDKEKAAKVKLVSFIGCSVDCKPYFHVIRWGFVLCGFNPETAKDDDQYLTDGMAFVLTVFSTYILPMMFGLLGTAIAAIRAIQNKVRDYELGPRDLILTLMGLPIGLVAGVAVGLFYAPSAVPSATGGNLAGDLSLSASGLGFLAGYGSEAFFKALDALLVRVFTTRGAPPPQTAPKEG